MNVLFSLKRMSCIGVAILALIHFLRAEDVTGAAKASAPTTPPTASLSSPAAKAAVPKASYFDEGNRSVQPANTESPLAVVASDPQALDLQDCFRISALRSDTLQISAQDIVAAQARLSQAIAQLYPTFNFVSSFNFQHIKSSSGSGGGAYVDSSGNVYSGSGSSGGRDFTTTTGINMNQTLFNGFANYNNVGAARAGVEVQRFNLQRSYQTLYANVAQSFYQILANEGDLVILADSIKALEGREKELVDRVHIGRSRPSELLQAQSDLASTRVTIEETKGVLAAARELMAFYLGIPADKIKLRESQKFPSTDALEKYISVMGVRPDILALVQAQRQAERTLSAAKGAFAPQVAASGNYNLAGDPEQKQEWTVGFTVTLPLFDGGLILNQVKEQKALTRQSELNLDNLRRSADQDVRTAFVNFNSSAAQVVKLQEHVNLAALSYNALTSDYKAGIVSNLDVLVALNSLQDARRQLNSADLNARLNLILLHVAAGLTQRSLTNSGTVTTTGTVSSMINSANSKTP